VSMSPGPTSPTTTATDGGAVDGRPPLLGSGGRSWGLGDGFIALGAYLFLAVSFGTVLVSVDGSDTLQAWLTCLAVSLPWLGLAGWPLFVTRWRGRGPVEDLRLRARPRDVGYGVLAGAVAIAIALPVASLTQHLLGHDISSAAGDLFDDVSGANPVPLVLFALLAGIGAPAVEEIAFRGLIYGAFEKRGTPVWLSVTSVAVLFALFHFEPERLPVLLVLGFALTWVRARTRSTGASIAAHMTVNFLPMLALLGDALSR
jgi:membrane protease YdiL (CAAX protease family)